MLSTALRSFAIRPSALLVAAMHLVFIFGLLTALNSGIAVPPDGGLVIVDTPPLPQPDRTPLPKDSGELLISNPLPRLPLPPTSLEEEPTDTSIRDVLTDSNPGTAIVPPTPLWVRADIRSRTEIEYPRLAKYFDEEGVVTLNVRIGIDGRPLEILIGATSGHGRLDQAALAAVAHWRFRPVTRDGVPIEGWTKLPIAFRLQD